ncbi:MAG TPA: hypothetical protein VGL08_15410 [Paraburkholderia sp.]
MFSPPISRTPSPHLSEVHVEPPAGTAKEHPAGTGHEKEGDPPRSTNLPSVVARPPDAGASTSTTSGPTPDAWLERYALKTKPVEYSTTDTPGVFADVEGQQKFIVGGGKAYAVAYDNNRRTYRIVNPDDPSRPIYPDRVDSQRTSATRSDVGVRGDARAEIPFQPESPEEKTQVTSKEHEIADYLLGRSTKSRSQIAKQFQVSEFAVLMVSANVELARKGWHDLQAAGAQQGQSGIAARLTPREKECVEKWSDLLSAGNFATLMGKPESAIQAYMQGDEYRSAAQPLVPKEKVSPGQGPLGLPPSSAPAAGTPRLIGTYTADLPLAKAEQIVAMLSNNLTLPYKEIARECAVSRRQVERLATSYRLRRRVGDMNHEVKSALIDDLVIHPQSSERGFMARYHLSQSIVRSVRDDFARAARDLRMTRDADIRAGRRELYASLTDDAKSLVRKWGGKLSAGNLSRIMEMPGSVIDSYMHSDEYGKSAAAPVVPPPSALSSAPPLPVGQWAEEPQAGPPGLQAPLTEEQKSEIRRWGSGGMLPDSLAMYLEKPQSTIEAYMQTDEYENYARTVVRSPPDSPR